jgi:tetratricopeptide (TPR) repeat protein
MGAGLLTLSLAVALVSWFGFARVEARLATLWPDEVRKEGRLSLWTRMFTVAKDFPVWGTGYGTFQYVEPLCRSNPADEEIYSNAENDYLEGLIEGGLVRLVLSLLAIGLVFRLGYRAVRRNEGSLASGLALGALLGFLTLVVHSFVDFGLHIPSIALLATVLCAQLCALGSTPGLYTLRLWGLAPLAGSALAILFGLALGYEGWRMYRVQELRRASSVSGFPDPARYAHRVNCLATATYLAPEDARLQVELALAYYDRYQEQRAKLLMRNSFADAARLVSDLAAPCSPLLAEQSILTIAEGWVITSAAGEELSHLEAKSSIRADLVPALRCFLKARDLCPLLPEPQRLLANDADKLERADARLTYLERAVFVVPYDPGLWYVCGEEWLEKEPDRTWKYWQRSLELSDVCLSPILEASAAHLAPREICERVLPHDPNLLLKAALQLYPQPTAERRPFLDKALSVLEKQPGPLNAKEFYVKASILCALDRWEEAIPVYQAAVAREPRQASWRFELARLLYQRKHLRESRRELLIVLLQQPGNQDARDLLASVEREIAASM